MHNSLAIVENIVEFWPAMCQEAFYNIICPFTLFLIRREEGDGVHNSLAIVENIVEFRPAVCKDAAQAGLLAWLVKKLKVKVPFDANKLYASEILSILLQNEPENRFEESYNSTCQT